MSEFNFHPQLIERIKELNYDDFTEVQTQVFPKFLENRNICVKTGYGAGKTASFVVPVIDHVLNSETVGIKSIILLPTRSLIYKVRKTVEMYTENLDATFYALTKSYLEDNLDLNQFDIIITTVHSLDKVMEHVNFNMVEQLVIDEIDLIHYFKQAEMLLNLKQKMTNLEHISIYTSRINEEVNRLVDQIDDSFEEITMDESETDLNDLDHKLYTVQEDGDKQNILRDILINEPLRRIVVFVDNNWTKKSVIYLLKNKLQVKSRWIDCERDDDFSEDIRLFMEGHYKVLVLNEYKGQDYHLRDVNQVINYDFPTDSKDYRQRCNMLSTKSVSYKDDAIINMSLVSDHATKEAVSNALNISFSEQKVNSTKKNDVVFGRVNKDRIKKIRI